MQNFGHTHPLSHFFKNKKQIHNQRQDLQERFFEIVGKQKTFFSVFGSIENVKEFHNLFL